MMTFYFSSRSPIIKDDSWQVGIPLDLVYWEFRSYWYSLVRVLEKCNKITFLRVLYVCYKLRTKLKQVFNSLNSHAWRERR